MENLTRKLLIGLVTCTLALCLLSGCNTTSSSSTQKSKPSVTGNTGTLTVQNPHEYWMMAVVDKKFGWIAPFASKTFHLPPGNYTVKLRDSQEFPLGSYPVTVQ
ncbi:MAG: hypothetical protein SGI98_04930 [Verrucomicrobiota bacterium]|nr:hypothetical protein [Verrucomicrobiota bacterium]